MPRLTISLADRTHRALKEAAARQNRSMASIIEESLGTERDPTLRYRQGDCRPGTSAVWIERSRRDGSGS